MPSKSCVICGKPCAARFWLCKACAVEYDIYLKPYSSWPSWVRGLIRTERRVARSNYRFYKQEITVNPATLEQIIDENHIKNQDC